MTDTRIEQIRDRWEKATPGPWECNIADYHGEDIAATVSANGCIAWIARRYLKIDGEANAKAIARKGNDRWQKLDGPCGG